MARLELPQAPRCGDALLSSRALSHEADADQRVHGGLLSMTTPSCMPAAGTGGMGCCRKRGAGGEQAAPLVFDISPPARQFRLVARAATLPPLSPPITTGSEQSRRGRTVEPLTRPV